MATYYGFNTIDQNKKFRLEDYELVKRDVLNSLLIKQGEKPGRPDYGTNVWNIVFEPMTDEIMREIEREIKRTVGQDPRIKIERLSVFPKENGVLIEIDVTVLSTTEVQRLTLFFDQNLNTVSAQ
jgi:phage baseplate assembly protein W